ncbi:hypothetical protein ASG38_00170 [Flavobacterium sp. Leaf359]|uniref:hypothetical protein n=1 Tax=Flavobacterium sp. Leaf359 TaxID=1736351 RepID=UPI0006F8F3DF|nr:hypothetical protein [Flavobacterium sp. Leaf359]KQS53201.1 hypothetical protein ASG38_00170 [Flavobacterium sp. Leaf359]PZQ78842.1 MAG: hypothetical protein DI548_15610 [Flavobacterium johnsoniae]
MIAAGGKFIDGFRQGVITSGLNHVAHNFKSYLDERSSFRSRFHKVDPDAKPAVNMSSVKALLNDVDNLAEIYKLATSPEIEIDITNDSKNRSASAEYFDETNTISLYRDAFRSNYQLARTLFHESYHALQYTFIFKGYTQVDRIRMSYGEISYNHMYGTQSRGLMFLEREAYRFVQRLGDGSSDTAAEILRLTKLLDK